MGETATVLHDFSLPSETSTSERMASVLSALGESVSFGRFLSESLDWGRFSSFNQEKYIEEAKQYSLPGSVAQKKAFFEARYKKTPLLRRSVSIMETSSQTLNNCDYDEVEISKDDSAIRVTESEVTIESFHTPEGKFGKEESEIEIEDEEIEQFFSEDNSIVDSSLFDKCVNFDVVNKKIINYPEKEPFKESLIANQPSEATNQTIEKTPRIPNLKSSRIPNPFKSIPFFSNKISAKENIANSSSRITSNHGKAPKSALHMSVDCPIRAEVTPSKADVRTKIARFEAVSKPLKTSSPGLKSKMVPEIAPQTPQCGQRKSAFGTSLADSSHISSGNSRVSSSRTENELREYRQSLCYKARPLPDFYRKNDHPKESNNKVASLRGQSNYNNIPVVPSNSKPVLKRISSSKLGAVSQSVADFSKEQNKWTITLARR